MLDMYDLALLANSRKYNNKQKIIGATQDSLGEVGYSVLSSRVDDLVRMGFVGKQSTFDYFITDTGLKVLRNELSRMNQVISHLSLATY